MIILFRRLLLYPQYQFKTKICHIRVPISNTSNINVVHLQTSHARNQIKPTYNTTHLLYLEYEVYNKFHFNERLHMK